MTLLNRLIGFVEVLSNIPDLAFSHIPQGLTDSQKAAYLLSAASIDEQANANLIHRLHRQIWDQMGSELLSASDPTADHLLDLLKQLYATQPPGRWIGTEAARKCILSAIRYSSKVGDLIQHAANFRTPKELVQDISRHVYRMGQTTGSAQKKAWMYMRWMVRPAPDLRLFKNFDPADLYTPVDSNVARAIDLLARQLPEDPILSILPRNRAGKVEANWRSVELTTKFARQMFPDDPVKIDYALFLLGRSLTKARGESCRTVLSECALGEMLDCNCACREGQACDGSTILLSKSPPQ